MIALFFSAYILAHSWYDPSCCGGNDCKPVPASELAVTGPDEWTYLPTGNKFNKQQIKPSKDGDFHVCIGNSPMNMGTSFCVYVPSFASH